MALGNALVEDAGCLGPDFVQGDAQAFENTGRHALALAHDADEQVLRADVVVTEPARLVDRQLNHLLGARCQPDVAGRGALAPADDELNGRADLGKLDTEAPQHTGSHAVGLSDKAKQDVLRPYVVVVEPLGLFLGQR